MWNLPGSRRGQRAEADRRNLSARVEWRNHLVFDPEKNTQLPFEGPVTETRRRQLLCVFRRGQAAEIGPAGRRVDNLFAPLGKHRQSGPEVAPEGQQTIL